MSINTEIKTDKFAILSFFIALLFLGFSFGYLSNQFEWFPDSIIKEAYKGYKSIMRQSVYEDNWVYTKTKSKNRVNKRTQGLMQPGLTAITSSEADYKLGVKIIEPDGSIVHQWKLDWFKIWPNATHINEEERPIAEPGTEIQGEAIMPNGDLVFNFEYIGLVRVDACGNVVWRLPKLTHHAIFLDENHHIWVPSRIYHDKKSATYPFHVPPFFEDTVLEVSPEGEVLQEISMLGLLIDNGYQGLLHILGTRVSNARTPDSVHLNDVEIFPSTLKEGVFSSGDVMVSFRNISTVAVFNPTDRKIKYISTGKVAHQHDADFIDGNHFSVVDNNNIDYQNKPFSRLRSRIMIESAIDGTLKVHYQGTEKSQYYTNIRGKHQWLDNGNMLISESSKGRAFEITPEGKIIWDYINIVTNGYAGIIAEAERLPAYYSKEFFVASTKQCLLN